MSFRSAALVIFDCDGVLIDSEPVAARHFATHAAGFGVTISPEEVLARFTGHADSAVARILREEFGAADPEVILAAGHDGLLEAFARELQPVEGIEGLIRALERPVCVASNSSVARLDRSLGLFPLRELFGGHVYSADMVARPKPAPDLVRLCLERLGSGAAAAVMIDDSPQGIAAARAAGVRAIGFITPGETRPGREAILRAAGAEAVAGSAAELRALFAV